MSYTTIFRDPHGFPRGYGYAKTIERSRKMAEWQLTEYLTYPNSGSLRGFKRNDFQFRTYLNDSLGDPITDWEY